MNAGWAIHRLRTLFTYPFESALPQDAMAGRQRDVHLKPAAAGGAMTG